MNWNQILYNGYGDISIKKKWCLVNKGYGGEVGEGWDVIDDYFDVYIIT